MSFVTRSRGQTILHSDINQFSTYFAGITTQEVSRVGDHVTSFADSLRQQGNTTGTYNIFRAGYGTAISPTWVLNVTSAGVTTPSAFTATGAAGGAGGLTVFGGATAPGTVGVGAAGANANHTFTVYRVTSIPQNMVMFDWGDTGIATDSSTSYFRAVQGDVNVTGTGVKTGWSSIRPVIAALQRYVTSDTPGYAAHFATHGATSNYWPITGTGQGTRILELGVASQVGRSGSSYIDEIVGVYCGNQAYGQLGEGQVGVKGNVAYMAHGIDNWQYYAFWLGPVGYPVGLAYPDSVTLLGGNNAVKGDLTTNIVSQTGVAGTTGTRGTIGADRTRPFFCVMEPGRIGVLTDTPLYALHLKALSSTDVANWTYPVVTATTTMIQVEMDSAAVVPAQIVAAGLTAATKQLRLGFNTTSNYGHLQAINNSTPVPLVLQAGGGLVGIGTTSVTARLQILPLAAEIGLVVQGNTTQSANLTEWWNIGSTKLAQVDKDAKAAFPMVTVGQTTNGGSGILFVKQSSAGIGGGVVVQEFGSNGHTGNFYQDANDFYFQFSGAGTRYWQFKGATDEIYTPSVIHTNTAFWNQGVKVVGVRGAAVADATGASLADTTAQLNALLARLRSTTGHGLIT